MRDESFDDMDALSQLKLASMRRYWWDAEEQSGSGENDGKKAEQEESLQRHSILTACLVEQRRKQQLEAPPYGFLECLDTIPQLSHWYDGMDPDLLNASEGPRPGSEPIKNQAGAETVAVPWRAADEDVDDIEVYSTAVVSPLLTELCSGRLEYPLWKVEHIHDKSLESDKLAMLVYFAVGAAIGRCVRADEDDDPDLEASVTAGIFFLRLLFEQQIVSPNLVTQLAFGGEFGFIRIAAGDQRLSIWQHFICWWATVAAASSEFETERDAGSGNKSLNDSREQHEVAHAQNHGSRKSCYRRG
ncbi:hypothetical protein VTI74DRAFT_5959 [Chaetomium olivicolor]